MGKIQKTNLKSKQNSKPGSRFKGKKFNSKSKSNKTPTLKQKLQKESKVVKVDSLNWKPVEIPDNLDDYEGLYGLEEIDGVDVQIVNGQAQFKVRDDAKLKKEENDKGAKDNRQNEVSSNEVNDDEDQNGDNEEDLAFDEEEEFTGFDDYEEEENQDDVMDNNEVLTEDVEAGVKESAEKSNSGQEELMENAFGLHVNLPDDNISLPRWKDIELSTYSLTGLNALKYIQPTPIQKKSIPLAIEGRDVIGKAITGSGKTLAYGIPILEKYISNLTTIKQNNQNKVINPPTGIIFVPTRELAHQVLDHLNAFSKFFPLSSQGIVSITGGLAIQKQERLLNNGPGIIIGTPGRFLELLEKDEELVKRLSATDIVVLDEADRLLQDGHFDEFERILNLFKKNRPKGLATWRWQTLVFSATFARELFGKLNKNVKINKSSLIEDDEILNLLNERLNFKDKKPILVDANPKEIVSGQITEALVECGPTERDLYLYYFLLVYKGSTLVFANSIDSVKRLVPFLNNLNIPAFAIHSSMIQKQRLRSLERFRAATENNDISVLVASDVAARGLDISNIDHVAHYHLPRSADVYIHRSGRTARAGNEGVSVMFCSPQEASGPLRELRKLLASNSLSKGKINVHEEVKLLPIEDDLVSQLKPRVEIASRLIGSIISNTSSLKENSWVKQAADDLGIDNLSDIEDFEDGILKKQRKRKENKSLTKQESKALRYELKQLLSQPIRKLSRKSYLTSGLQNLAHIMVTGKTHKEILGHENSKALQDLKGKSSKVTKPGSNKRKQMKADKNN